MTDETDLPKGSQKARDMARGWHNVVGASADELERAEIEALFAYGDIIDLPAYEPKRHPRQPRGVRAAQFSPFAALTGYSDVIDEAGRLTEDEVDLADDMRDVLDDALGRLQASMSQSPVVTVTYFEPDDRKSGGRYRKAQGVVRRIDPVGHALLFEDGTSVPISTILSLDFAQG